MSSACDLGWALTRLHRICSLVGLDLMDFGTFRDTHTLLAPEDGVLENLTRLQLSDFSDVESTFDLGEDLLALLIR